jgi:transcriptional regulator of aromatic amino acid metabolism
METGRLLALAVLAGSFIAPGGQSRIWCLVAKGQFREELYYRVNVIEIRLRARHDDNISAAAKAAGIDRKTFHRLITDSPEDRRSHRGTSCRCRPPP